MSKSENTVSAKALIHEQKDIEGLCNLLDGIGHEERVVVTQALNRKDQKALWSLSKDFRPIALEDIVSQQTGSLKEVRHIGKNTLPLFTHFEKRFCRPEKQGDREELLGYNWGVTRPVVGPGYFTAYFNDKTGEVDIDYRVIPNEKIQDWPEIKDNNGAISRFVFGNMVDSLRRVSEHVTIGSAAKNGKPMGSWFVLCREA